MSRRKKKQVKYPPKDTEQWILWAQEVFDTLEEDVNVYKAMFEEVKEYLHTTPGQVQQPDVHRRLPKRYKSLQQYAGLLARMEYSFDDIMNVHDAKAIAARQAARPFEVGDLVKLIPMQERRIIDRSLNGAIRPEPGAWDAFKLLYRNGFTKTNDLLRLAAMTEYYSWEELRNNYVMRRGFKPWSCPQHVVADVTANMLEKYRPVFEALNVPVAVPNGKWGESHFTRSLINDMPDVHYHVVDIHANAVLIMADSTYWIVRTKVLEFAGE